MTTLSAGSSRRTQEHKWHDHAGRLVIRNIGARRTAIGIHHHLSRIDPGVARPCRPHDREGTCRRQAPNSSGLYFFVWTLLTLQVTAIFSLVLSALDCGVFHGAGKSQSRRYENPDQKPWTTSGTAVPAFECCATAIDLHSGETDCAGRRGGDCEQHRVKRDALSFGKFGNLFTGVAVIFLTLAFYDLFKRVNWKLAALIILVGGVLPSAIYFANIGTDAAALTLARGGGGLLRARGANVLSAFDQPQREALMMFFLHLHNQVRTRRRYFGVSGSFRWQF